MYLSCLLLLPSQSEKAQAGVEHFRGQKMEQWHGIRNVLITTIINGKMEMNA